MSLEIQIKKMKDDIKDIASKHGVTKISLFGSVARSEDVISSDVDFLVDFEEGRSLFDLIRLKQDLETLLERPVDVVTAKAIHWMIKDQILSEAVQL